MGNTCFIQNLSKGGRLLKVMRHILRELIEAGYALFVMACIGKWALYYAYLERGYRAVGGECCLILMVYWIAYKVMHYTLDALEELKHEQTGKKRRS